VNVRGYHIRLARAEELSALPEIEREAAARFAPYGLAEPLSAILTPSPSARGWLIDEGRRCDDRPWGCAG
jgi:hypothetical protein